MKTKPLTFLLSLTFLFLFSGSVFGQEEVKEEHWDNGKLKWEEHYKDGEKDGVATFWYKNGQVETESHYKDGKLNGLLSRWYPNGKKMSEIPYIDGKENGFATSWYISGEKRQEENTKMEK